MREIINSSSHLNVLKIRMGMRGNDYIFLKLKIQPLFENRLAILVHGVQRSYTMHIGVCGSKKKGTCI